MDKRWTIAAGTGAGAAVAYLLDPERGGRRRAQLRDKAVRYVKKTRHGVDVTYRDTINRLKGAAAESRHILGPEEIDDEVLVERVRSRLGHLVTHPSAIQVDAKEGRVMLSGPVLTHELDDLIGGVRRVKGVSDVENRLDAFDEPDDVPGLQGRGRRPRKIGKEHWTPATRLAAGAGGAGLLTYAVLRRGVLGLGSAAAGTSLLARALTNISLDRLTGIGSGRRGIDIQKTIHVDAPVDQVYEFWTRYENFPRFMTHVKEVNDLEGGRSRWVVEGPAGAPIHFDAEVTVRHENERFGWKSADGSAIAHAGLVEFDREEDGRTRVQLRLTYNPVAGGIGHAVAKLMGADPKQRLDSDLVRMKTLLETGNPPSDAGQG